MATIHTLSSPSSILKYLPVHTHILPSRLTTGHPTASHTLSRPLIVGYPVHYNVAIYVINLWTLYGLCPDCSNNVRSPDAEKPSAVLTPEGFGGLNVGLTVGQSGMIAGV
jgi:hypothetical protein